MRRWIFRIFLPFLLKNNLQFYPTEEVSQFCNFYFYKTSFSLTLWTFWNAIKCRQSCIVIPYSLHLILTTTWNFMSDIRWYWVTAWMFFFLFYSRDYWSNHIKLNLMEWWTFSGKCSVYFWNVSLINIYTQIKIIFFFFTHSLTHYVSCCCCFYTTTKCN
jgi:hypothetical protein